MFGGAILTDNDPDHREKIVKFNELLAQRGSSPARANRPSLSDHRLTHKIADSSPKGDAAGQSQGCVSGGIVLVRAYAERGEVALDRPPHAAAGVSVRLWLCGVGDVGEASSDGVAGVDGSGVDDLGVESAEPQFVAE